MTTKKITSETSRFLEKLAGEFAKILKYSPQQLLTLKKPLEVIR
jgi:hypothetical protein